MGRVRVDGRKKKKLHAYFHAYPLGYDVLLRPRGNRSFPHLFSGGDRTGRLPAHGVSPVRGNPFSAGLRKDKNPFPPTRKTR